MNVLQYNDKIYIFNNNKSEPYKFYNERNWFIIKNLEKFENNLSYLEKLSYIWINHKYLGVTYNKDIMDIINSCNDLYEFKK